MRVLHRSPWRIAAVLLVALLIGYLAWSVQSAHHSISQLQKQRDASCIAFASVGEVTLSPTSSPLAKRIVTTHKAAAKQLGCAK